MEPRCLTEHNTPPVVTLLLIVVSEAPSLAGVIEPKYLTIFLSLELGHLADLINVDHGHWDIVPVQNYFNYFVIKNLAANAGLPNRTVVFLLYLIMSNKPLI